jgi:hypothetical protein
MKLSKRYVVCETMWDKKADVLIMTRSVFCRTRKEALEIMGAGRPHRMQRFMFRAEVREL